MEFCRARVLPSVTKPLSMVVVPVKVLAASRVVVLVPVKARSPVPLITPETVSAVERSKVSVPLLTMSPTTEPVVPPSPSWRVPALMVVVPV